MNRPDDLQTRLRATLRERADTVHPHVRPFDPNRATGLTGERDELHRPTPTATGRWVRGVSVVAAAIVLIVGVTFATNRGEPADDAAQVAAEPGNAVGSSTSASSGVSIDSLNGLFVATSAEYNGPTFASSWTHFASRAWQAGLGRCLGEDGERFTPESDGSAAVPGTFRNNTQFPDLAKLKGGTFVDEAPSMTLPDDAATAAESTDDASSRAAESGACDPQEAESYRSLADEVNVWVDRWGVTIDGIDADPTVSTARSDYVACMADQGLAVTAMRSSSDVFGLADEAQRNGDTARVAQLARAYGTCFEPVSEAMDDYRLAKRAEFYRTHETELLKLAGDIDRAEARLSAEYGIPRS